MKGAFMGLGTFSLPEEVLNEIVESTFNEIASDDDPDVITY